VSFRLITIIGFLAAFAATFGAGWYFGTLQGDLAVERQNNADYAAMEKASKEALERATHLEFENQKLRKESKNRNERIVYVRKTTDINSCKLPVDGLRAINEARAASNTSSEPDG